MPHHCSSLPHRQAFQQTHGSGYCCHNPWRGCQATGGAARRTQAGHVRCAVLFCVSRWWSTMTAWVLTL
jgi:hypothetical protein